MLRFHNVEVHHCCHNRCVRLDLICKNYYFVIKTRGSMSGWRWNNNRANWISWLQYKPINLTLRQLTENGVVQYHKSKAPRSYLQNSLSLSNCTVPVFVAANPLSLSCSHLHTNREIWPRATSSFNDDSCRAFCPCSRALLTPLHVNDDFPLRQGAAGSPRTKSGARVYTCLTRDPPRTSLW